MARPNPEKTKAGNLRAPSPALVAQWVIDCWNDIDPQVIVSSFLRAGISNDMSGDQDDLVCHVFDKDHPDELDEEFGAVVLST